jgi:zinc/manganese transport system substrate-binding protein
MLRNLRFAGVLAAATIAFTLPASAEQLKVVATFSIIADFASNVGGDRIELTTLVGPDGDAHVYEPKPADAVAMAGADVVLVNGLKFEGFLQRLVDASATKARVVDLSSGVKTLEMKDAGDAAKVEEASQEPDQSNIDPHAFQSIPNAEIYVKNIADAFCAADAGGCDAYKANAEAYTASLRALDAELRTAVASIPRDKRVIITSHDAFGYLAREYGITFLAPEGISTEAEASAADVAALIRQVKEDKASAVFVENVTNPRLIEQIASEASLKVGGVLFSDALSPAGGPAATYIDMMRHNIAAIRGAIIGS